MEQAGRSESPKATSYRKMMVMDDGAEHDDVHQRRHSHHSQQGSAADGETRTNSASLENAVQRRARGKSHGSETDQEPDGLMLKQPETAKRHEVNFWQTFAGIAGNVLEWYDFAVFGYFVDIIALNFFPPDQDGNAAQVEAFAVFGGAFLMRPVGGLLLGYIGDVYGRKRALVLSIFLMAFPTFAMGCLPTYQQVGVVSTILLILVRMLQGLSVGGQLMSSLVFTLEGHDSAHWGLYGSYVMAAANFGTLLGGVTAEALRGALTPNQLETWGWRLPFLAGIIVSLSGIYLRTHNGEGEGHHGHAHTGHVPVSTSPAEADGEHRSPDHVDEEHSSSQNHHHDGHSITPAPATSVNPLSLAFSKDNRRSLAASSLVPMLWSAGFYLSFVWMADYMSDLIEEPVPHALAVNSSTLLLSVCLFFPVAGILSDRYGRRQIMIIGGASMGLLSPLLVALIGKGNPVAAWFCQLTLGIALSFWGSPMMAWLVEAFDPASRLTSVSIGYNIAQAAGGVAPSLATWMVDAVGQSSPGWILTGLSAVSLGGLLLIAPPPPETSHCVQSFDAVPATAEGGGEHEMVDLSTRATTGLVAEDEDHEML